MKKIWVLDLGVFLDKPLKWPLKGVSLPPVYIIKNPKSITIKLSLYVQNPAQPRTQCLFPCSYAAVVDKHKQNSTRTLSNLKKDVIVP